MTKDGKKTGGKPKGYKAPKTLEKEAARAILRQRVTERLLPMVDAQIDNAMGIRHFIVRGPAGKFERLTDPVQIEAALNAEGATEGSTYWIYTKDPCTPAFTDLLNRTIDKPAEHVALTGVDDGPITFKWQS
jgi:hypothetical protein